jgi:hypothetical protein
MTAGLWIIGSALQAVWLALLIYGGFALYRTLRLPSLPWLGAHYGFKLIIFPAVSAFLRDAESAPFSPLAFVTASYQASVYICVGSLTNLLAVVIAFSDVAFLISKAYPNMQSRVLSFFLGVRRHVTSLGIILMALTVLNPILMILFHFSER